MKKLVSLLLVLVILAGTVGCTPNKEPEETTVPTETTVETTQEQTTTEETEPEETKPEETPSSPVLYKATDDQGHTVYMLGSIHVGTDAMYPLPQYVMDAYNASSALAVELDMIAVSKDMAGATEMAQSMLLTDGTKISDHISEECYDRAVEILKDNKSYYKALDSFKPVMWYSLISTLAMEEAGADSDRGIDMHFLELAYDDEKTIYEVESAEFQYSLLGGMSMELQVLLLEQTVAMYGTAVNNMGIRLMCNAWATGNEEGILNMSETDTAGMPADQVKLLEEFNTSLEGQRNVDMTKFAENALLSGETVFIVVGAAHVFGEDGMAQGLEKLGYTVEKIQE